MNIVVPRKDLVRLLERCAPVADKKSAVPMLANVLLTAEGRVVRVAATDLYMSVSGSADAEVTTPGTIALPGKDLFERVKAMPDGPIQITTDDKAQAVVRAVGQARRYTLHALPGADFPMLPKPPVDGAALDLPADLLAMLLARTHFSISPDETRAHVNSLLVEYGAGMVRAVSTDGHRLSKAEAQHGGATTSMLIPLKAVSELRRIVDGAKGQTVDIRQSTSTAFFTVNGFTFSTKLIDATFPPYQQVIPEIRNESMFCVRRVALIDALKAVQLAASDRIGGVVLTLVPGTLRISATSAESGEGLDEIPVDYNGAERKVGVNAKYLLDVATALDSEEVEMMIQGELDPMCVYLPGSAAYAGVVMPMRTT